MCVVFTAGIPATIIQLSSFPKLLPHAVSRGSSCLPQQRWRLSWPLGSIETDQHLRRLGKVAFLETQASSNVPGKER